MEINCTYALDITNSVTVVIFITVIWIFVRLSGLFGLFRCFLRLFRSGGGLWRNVFRRSYRTGLFRSGVGVHKKSFCKYHYYYGYHKYSQQYRYYSLYSRSEPSGAFLLLRSVLTLRSAILFGTIVAFIVSVVRHYLYSSFRFID